MFAGPNGSGKSTLKSRTGLNANQFGVYLNPDEIEAAMGENRYLDLSRYGASASQSVWETYSENHRLLQRIGLSEESAITWKDNALYLTAVSMNSYIASLVTDFIRERLLEARVSFTFETVMSHSSKIDVLRKAKDLGYRTYLYFVATDSVEINLSRVASRVRMGGHSVPDQKVVERYNRSLDMLYDAIRQTDRAFVFDNSSENCESHWIAEITNGKELVLKSNLVPKWFENALLQKIRIS